MEAELEVANQETKVPKKFRKEERLHDRVSAKLADLKKRGLLCAKAYVCPNDPGYNGKINQ